MEIRCKPVSGIIPGNPNNIILDFEKTFLDIICDADSRDQYQAVLVDSATNAIELCCIVNKIENKSLLFGIPNRTYVSIPQTIERYHSYQLIDKEWDNWYKMGNIIDSAGYIPSNKEIDKMFKDPEVDYLILSFGNSKPFPMNRGGLIIFNKKKLNEPISEIMRYDLLKRLSHNGRDSAIPVEKDTLLKVNSQIIGRKFNLVPEQIESYLYKLVGYKNREEFLNTLQVLKIGSFKYPKIETL